MGGISRFLPSPLLGNQALGRKNSPHREGRGLEHKQTALGLVPAHHPAVVSHQGDGKKAREKSESRLSQGGKKTSQNPAPTSRARSQKTPREILAPSSACAPAPSPVARWSSPRPPGVPFFVDITRVANPFFLVYHFSRSVDAGIV